MKYEGAVVIGQWETLYFMYAGIFYSIMTLQKL
jgi:hypothetical protein